MDNEPVELSLEDSCPNPACHCIHCICGEDCRCSFLERCPCAFKQENIPCPPEETS